MYPAACTAHAAYTLRAHCVPARVSVQTRGSLLSTVSSRWHSSWPTCRSARAAPARCGAGASQRNAARRRRESSNTRACARRRSAVGVTETASRPGRRRRRLFSGFRVGRAGPAPPAPRAAGRPRPGRAARYTRRALRRYYGNTGQLVTLNKRKRGSPCCLIAGEMAECHDALTRTRKDTECRSGPQEAQRAAAARLRSVPYSTVS